VIQPPSGRTSTARRAWRFAGKTRGRWCLPDEAAAAVALHQTGLIEWDQQQLPVSGDLLDWRPLGDSI